jgi:hypothetical protein
MRHLAPILIASALFVGGTEARAEPLPKPRYYGWQNIVVGYTGIGLAVHGYFSNSDALLATGVATWMFGGTVVHAAHRNGGAAAATPFVTAGITLAALGLGAATESEAVLALGAVYALVAPIIDGAWGHDEGGDAPVFTRVGIGVGRG